MMPSQDPTVRRRPWRAVLILSVLFLLGLGCGVGGTLLVIRRSIQQQMMATDMPERAPVDRLMERIGERLARELDLDESQSQAVKKELSKTAWQIKQLRLQGAMDTRRITADTLKRIEQHVPESRRSELRRRAVTRLAPWGLLREEE